MAHGSPKNLILRVLRVLRAFVKSRRSYDRRRLESPSINTVAAALA
jgi:hypothetical protein